MYRAIVALGLASSLSAATTAFVPVCCNADSTVSIIDTATNKVTGSFTAGLGSYAVTLAKPDIAWVANAADKTISIDFIQQRAVFRTIKLTLQPWLIQTSPDGKRVYAITGNFKKSLSHYPARLYAFDASSAKVITSVPLPNDGLPNPGLAISPDSKQVYATFDSQTVVVFDATQGKTSATWQTTRALTWTATGTLTLSQDGKTLYTAGQVLTAIDTTTGKVTGTATPPGPARGYSFVGSALSADGATLYASYAAQIGTGSGVAAIDAGTLQITNSAALGSELQQPILSHDGSTLYVADALDSIVYVVNASTLAATAALPQMGSLASMSLSADGKFLFVPSSSTASVVQVDTATLATRGFIGVSGTPSAASATADGRHVYVAGAQSNTVTEIDVPKAKVSRVFSAGALTPSVSGVNPTGVLVTPNGKRLYLAGEWSGGVIGVIKTASGALTGVACNSGDCGVSQMTALPDSSLVYLSGFAAFGESGVPMFWAVDAATQKIVFRQKLGVAAMAAAPSGKYLYLSTGSQIQIFDTVHNMFTGSVAVAHANAIAFSPAGATAYATAGSNLVVIDTATGQATATYGLGPTGASALSVSPDGSQVWISLAKSTSVVVFNTASKTSQTLDFGLAVQGVAFGGQ